jgi:DivIVA domain-containing protein
MRKNKTEDADVPEGGRRASSGSGPAGRLTPLDIQQVEFRRSFKGYDEREVDEFLDRLTEDFAAALDEAQRLRDRAEGGLGVVVAGTADQAAARREAEEILQRARDEAARIVREAEAGAARGPAAGGLSEGDRAAISAFLSTERSFLTSLASLVQGHAETVKGMAASAQRRSTATAPAGGPTPGPTPPPVGPRPQASPGERAGDGGPDLPGVESPVGPESQGRLPRGAAEASPAEPAATPPGEGHVTIPEPDRATARAGDPQRSEGDPGMRDLFWRDE